MTLSIYDTAVLVEVVQNLKTPSQFLVDSFFDTVIEYETKEVAIDVDAGKRRIAPFVSPLVEGKPVEARSYQTNSFAPAYIKDKRQLDPMRPVARALGERIGGSMTAADREMANIRFEIEDQIQMIQRRLEWMAASALATGSVVITGDGYPSVTVNFQRDSSLTVTLSGSATWTATQIANGTATPSANVNTWAALVLQKSGAVVTDVLFTNTAWNAFILDPTVKAGLISPNVDDVKMKLGAGLATGAIFKGVFGTFMCWLYNDWYVDSSDTEQPMIADKTVILVSRALKGVRAFGAIIDPTFSYGALAYAPKSWITQDPAQRNIMMQSAPMVIPSRVNASFAATVA